MDEEKGTKACERSIETEKGKARKAVVVVK